MILGLWYIVLHIAAVLFALALVIFRTGWMWVPFGILFALESFMLWRVLDGSTNPVWLTDSFSMGLALFLLGAPLIRLLRFRNLFASRAEQIGLIFILIVQVEGAVTAYLAGNENEVLMERSDLENVLRKHVIDNDLDSIERILAKKAPAVENDRSLATFTILSAVQYGNKVLAHYLAIKYPQSVTPEILYVAIVEGQTEFTKVILGQTPGLVSDLIESDRNPAEVAVDGGDLIILNQLLDALSPSEQASFGGEVLLHATKVGNLEFVETTATRFPASATEALSASLGGPVLSDQPGIVTALMRAGAIPPADFKTDRTFDGKIHPESLSERDQKEIWQEVLNVLNSTN